MPGDDSETSNESGASEFSADTVQPSSEYDHTSPSGSFTAQVPGKKGAALVPTKHEPHSEHQPHVGDALHAPQ
eukprot:COSAG06_NODE_51388_length_312_cov_1.201878_1_plen_72_part_01